MKYQAIEIKTYNDAAFIDEAVYYLSLYANRLGWGDDWNLVQRTQGYRAVRLDAPDRIPARAVKKINRGMFENLIGK